MRFRSTEQFLREFFTPAIPDASSMEILSAQRMIATWPLSLSLLLRSPTISGSYNPRISRLRNEADNGQRLTTRPLNGVGAYLHQQRHYGPSQSYPLINGQVEGSRTPTNRVTVCDASEYITHLIKFSHFTKSRLTLRVLKLTGWDFNPLQP